VTASNSPAAREAVPGDQFRSSDLAICEKGKTTMNKHVETVERFTEWNPENIYEAVEHAKNILANPFVAPADIVDYAERVMDACTWVDHNGVKVLATVNVEGLEPPTTRWLNFDLNLPPREEVDQPVQPDYAFERSLRWAYTSKRCARPKKLLSFTRRRARRSRLRSSASRSVAGARPAT
jgi:hypothetical protein